MHLHRTSLRDKTPAAPSPQQRNFDANRHAGDGEDLALIFSWLLPRKLSLSLTLRDERVIYCLKDTRSNER
jgi:hypothetical protein